MELSMPIDHRERVKHRQRFTVCSICQREIPRPAIVTYGLIFCPEHQREFKLRRKEGVRTDELSTQWGDTLKNWRERPPELDEEAKTRFFTTPFLFRGKVEDWLVFERSYYQFELPRRSRSTATILRNPRKDPWRLFKRQKSSPRRYRLSDFLGVHAQTGEIRRFVDVASNEVWDDLRGIHPAPAQAELAPYWGRRKPSGIREQVRSQLRQQLRGERGHVRIRELVRSCHFPFYGPVGNPLGLVLTCSLSWFSSYIDTVSGVGFVYSRASQPDIAIELEVSDAKRPVYAPVDNGTSDSLYLALACEFFERTYEGREEQAMVENFTTWKGDLTIAGNPFTGDLYSWSQPDQLSWFSLSNEQTRLTGNAHGLSQDEVLHWLQDLQIINERDEILSVYQREFDEDWQRRWIGETQ
jgi:hypothetical protein